MLCIRLIGYLPNIENMFSCLEKYNFCDPEAVGYYLEVLREIIVQGFLLRDSRRPCRGDVEVIQTIYATGLRKGEEIG